MIKIFLSSLIVLSVVACSGQDSEPDTSGISVSHQGYIVDGITLLVDKISQSTLLDFPFSIDGGGMPVDCNGLVEHISGRLPNIATQVQSECLDWQMKPIRVQLNIKSDGTVVSYAASTFASLVGTAGEGTSTPERIGCRLDIDVIELLGVLPDSDPRIFAGIDTAILTGIGAMNCPDTRIICQWQAADALNARSIVEGCTLS